MMNAEIVLNSHRDALAAERLTERFAELTWKTVAPITALSVTFFLGALACAQFFAVRI